MKNPRKKRDGARPLGSYSSGAGAAGDGSAVERQTSSAKARVAHIWRGVRKGSVDLAYAAVGYDFRTGRPVYDYDILVDLLVNYGYGVDDAAAFIDELSVSGVFDGFAPVIMNSAFRTSIYADIEHLDGIPCG